MTTINPSFTTFSPTALQAGATAGGSFVSAASASRTVTPLANGALAVDDTFVRRSIIQPNNWMQSLGGAGAIAPCCPQSAPAPAAAPKKKKKKHGLKGFAKKLKKTAKKGIKTLKKIVKKPFQIAKQLLGVATNPLQLLGGGIPGGR